MSNVPNLRFPEFEGEWEETQLSEYLEFKNGLNTDAKKFGKGVKFISVMDILNNQYITYDNIIGLVDVDIETQKRYDVNYGDILFQRSSETFEDIGQANVYLDNKSAIFGGFVIRGKRIGNYYPIFFKYLLNSPTARKKVIVKGAGAQHYNIGQEGLSSVYLHFPKIEEQTKIASFLSLIEQRISTQSQIVGELETLIKGLSEKLFSQKLRFKDDNENDYPDWEIRNLKDIVNIKMGQSPDSSSYNFEGIGVPLIQGNADITDRKSNPRQYTNNPTKLCRIGDLLLTVRAPVGYIAKSLHNACIGRGICSIENNEYSLIEFIYQFLLHFENNWKSIEQGSTFTSVNSSDIGSISIKVPSIKEQAKIANFLSAIDEKLETEKQILKKYTEQKKYLLANMFM